MPIIDDAPLMQTECLRKLRLLFEDFQRSHKLVLIGQPALLQSLSLTNNEEIRSLVTYSTVLPRLGSEETEKFILYQFDRAGLGHNALTQESITSPAGMLSPLEKVTQTTSQQSTICVCEKHND